MLDFVLIEKGWWTTGVTTAGRGVVVVNPRYVAFVPTQRPQNWAAGVAWAAGGFVPVGGKGKIPTEWVIYQLQTGPLDQRVHHLCADLGGQVWVPATARAHEQRSPVLRKQRGLWFRSGKQSIRCGRSFGIAEFDHLRLQMAGWTWDT
ncbi:MAG: hypothetical protein DLM59_01205 [Pseudonocardiales bacterium]|nr:MAG: hypothetical protein DLM59_01205 [Pseudonocardiales bacterium]